MLILIILSESYTNNTLHYSLHNHCTTIVFITVLPSSLHCTTIVSIAALPSSSSLHYHHHHNCTFVVTITALPSSPSLHFHRHNHCTIIVTNTALPSSPTVHHLGRHCLHHHLAVFIMQFSQ